MLQHLHIRNYALISQLDIDLNNGFSVITGETGAGKSIILGALGLIMGERADVRAITEGEQKCIIEAEFTLQSADWETRFALYDLDYATPCTIRRELSISGKSRAFVNDTPVSLNILRELTSSLIDIHSQHENLLLRDDHFQLSIVDAVAANKTQRDEYETEYKQYKQLDYQLKQLQEQAQRSKADYDYILFQHKQLAEAQLQADELEMLEAEQQMLTHAEDIRQALSMADGLLNGEQSGAIQSLKDALAALRKIDAYLPAESALTSRLESAYIELRDIADEAQQIADRTDFDPERLLRVEERLDLLNTLLQKHRKQTIDELIILRDQLEEQIGMSDSYEEQIAQLQKQLQAQHLLLSKAADTLSHTRRAVVKPISEQLEHQLTKLGIAHAHIDISIEDTDYSETGKDNVQIMFAANKNQALRRVVEVASGGEIARIMLCLKALIASETSLPTIIFDEVDTGVSGEVAGRMGEIMHQMAAGRQVIAITHLPQIAAQGERQYKVYKSDNDSRTETHIRLLSETERVAEIATLLSGTRPTEAALQNAKELLGYNPNL